jgi:aconitate hydratase
LSEARATFRKHIPSYVNGNGDQGYSKLDESVEETFPASDPGAVSNGHADDVPQVHSAAAHAKGRPSNPVTVKSSERGEFVLDHGAVVIAAVTSCTNTSNPEVMLGAALLARNAVEKGLASKPWVKTTMAPGSQVVNDYYDKAGLWPYLEKLGFYLVGYGCTTCIGNSGPLPDEVSKAINDNDLSVTAVLSGNRNFEGRINPDVKMNYLASPPLVVAYALAGSMDFDFESQPLGQDKEGKDVYLKDIWPSQKEVSDTIASAINSEMFTKNYADVFKGDERWRNLPTPSGNTFEWDADSTYVRKPPYFEGMPAEPEPVADIIGARVLALLGDSVTTDHISPASSIKPGTPAAQYLDEHGVERKDYNSFGSRRGNHEVMIRGTFANIRLRNLLLDDVSGGYTRDFTQDPVDGKAPQAFIYDAAQNYAAQDIPLVVLGGKEYGSGSSRDWAAKGTRLLGVRAVIAESFERIHRSNLIGMGVIPLQFPEGKSAKDLGLDGTEVFDITGIEALNDGKTPKTVKVKAGDVEFDAVVRIDTPGEADYYRNGGILQYVLRNMLKSG